MFSVQIGDTPQEQLTYIRKVHKWTNIIAGAIAAWLIVICLVAVIMEKIHPVYLALYIVIVPLLLFWSLRAIAWGFLWLKSKFTKQTALAVGSVLTSTLNSGEEYLHIQRDTMTGDYKGTWKKDTNWLPVILICFIFYYVIVWAGLIVAIKHTLLAHRLKKQVNAA